MKNISISNRFLKLALIALLSVLSPLMDARAQAPQMQMAISQKRTTASGIALVQQAAGTSATGNATLTVNFPAPTTPGNLIVVCASYLSTAAWADEPTLNLDGVMVLDGEQFGATVVADIYALIAAGANTSVSARLNSINRLNLHVSEWSSIASAAQEASNGNENTASSVVDTGAVTPISTRNLVIGIGTWTANDYSSGPTNGFTAMTPTGGGLVWQEVAYLIQSSIAQKSTGWSLTAGVDWSSAIIAFGGT